MADYIATYWLKSGYHKGKDTLILNADNGPENSSRRTQFMKRMMEFSVNYNVKVILAYYPPYHSKYNPIERVWERLEQHWNGDLLDTREAVLGFASSMTWNGKNPFVALTEKLYESGKKVEKEVMKLYETAIERADGLEKWFVTLNPKKCKEVLDMEIKVYEINFGVRGRCILFQPKQVRSLTVLYNVGNFILKKQVNPYV